LLLTLINLAGHEIAVTRIGGLEVTAIDGYQCLRKQLQIAAQNDKPATDVANNSTLFTSKADIDRVLNALGSVRLDGNSEFTQRKSFNRPFTWPYGHWRQRVFYDVPLIPYLKIRSGAE
jgi:hypothetical protein